MIEGGNVDDLDEYTCRPSRRLSRAACACARGLWPRSRLRTVGWLDRACRPSRQCDRRGIRRRERGGGDGAQRDKLDITCRKLRLAPGETLLDIGCGWGALVCHAAQHYGVRAHGVTLAQQQFDLAKEKVARLGLQDRVTLELRDYSTLEGSYDKIASIGMFEHVGFVNHEA